MKRKQSSAPERIERSEKERRQICAFDYFFNAEKERRMDTTDRRYGKNRSKWNLATIFLG